MKIVTSILTISLLLLNIAVTPVAAEQPASGQSRNSHLNISIRIVSTASISSPPVMGTSVSVQSNAAYAVKQEYDALGRPIQVIEF